MSNIAMIGVRQSIEVAETALDAAITALEETKDVAVAAGQAVVNVGGRTADVVLDEMKKLKAELVESLKETADAVTEPLP